jgi:hypothetical protein
MVVQKVAIVKNMLICTICNTFNVATNKTMVVKDTTMQIVAVAYILRDALPSHGVKPT